MSRNIFTGEEEQRIMPNTRSPVIRQVIRPQSYTQMLREAKAKRALRQLNTQNRKELISNTIAGAQRAGSLVKGAGSAVISVGKAGKARLEKTRYYSGLIGKVKSLRKKSIYDWFLTLQVYTLKNKVFQVNILLTLYSLRTLTH